MIYQIYWKRWHWFWHSKIEDNYYKGVYHNFGGFGPFQFSWYSSK